MLRRLDVNRQKGCDVGRYSPALHHPDLFLTQPVQRIDQPVKLPIRGGDLRGEDALLVRRAGGWACFVQRQHLLHQPHDVVVAGAIVAKVIQLYRRGFLIKTDLRVVHKIEQRDFLHLGIQKTLHLPICYGLNWIG